MPDLLTVGEAAAVLRIGRTKAYDLAREWRATGGASGLPVVDLGNVLRVSRYALEDMVGGPLSLPDDADEAHPSHDDHDDPDTPDTPDAPSPISPRRRTRARHSDGQLHLFDASTRS